MSLQSLWFRGNTRLQQCIVSDPSHVKRGDKGEHVTLIQGALLMLSKCAISTDEQARQFYGDSTEKAVLKYKKDRQIINFRYQTAADNIVGRMTMYSLDFEMLAYEGRRFHPLLAAGIPPRPRGVIIIQAEPLAMNWAKQVVAANPNFTSWRLSGHSAAEIARSIKSAIQAAHGGVLIFAVGHGVSLDNNAGVFDLAEAHQLRIGGKGANRDPKAFTDVFYEDRNPQPSPLSDKEIDEQVHPGGWQERLRRWAIYKDLCQAFVNGKLQLVVLLTCNIGQSLDFLKKVASQWHTPLLAYRDFVWYAGIFPHIRAVLDKDMKTPGVGTNVPFSEITIPLTTKDMVVVAP